MVPDPGLTPQPAVEPQPAAVPPTPGSPPSGPQPYPPPGQPYPPGGLPPGGLPPYAPAGLPPSVYPPPQQRAKPSALPVQEREYHEFFRAPRFRWWKPLAALGMLLGTAFVVIFAVSFLVLAEVASGRVTLEELLAGRITPMAFLANNLSLAALVPLSYLTAWAVFGQRPRWLASIAGGFRWGLFGRFAGVAAVVLAVTTGLELALTGGVEGAAWNQDSLFLIVTILVTTPFQAAGEEYALRGLGSRAIGSWFGSRRVGLVVSTAVTAFVFMLLHGAGDPWLNGFYVLFAVAASVLVWRTGGLEAAVALHVVNNLIGEAFLPFTPIDDLFNRQAGVAGPEIGIQVAAIVVATGLMLWLGKRRGLASSAAPGRQGESGAGGVLLNSAQFG